MIGYCMKCRQKREMKKVVDTLVGKRKAVKGICIKCGTNMFKFV